MMQLVVGWTLVGGFVFTMLVTCLSLVGVVRFADPKQQRMLFKALVLQLVVGVGGKVAGAWRFDARDVGAEVHAEGKVEGGAEVGAAWIASLPTAEAAESSRADVLEAVEALELPAGSHADERRAVLVEGLRVAPGPQAFSSALRDVGATRIRMP
jgi:hypothetical protein